MKSISGIGNANFNNKAVCRVATQSQKKRMTAAVPCCSAQAPRAVLAYCTDLSPTFTPCMCICLYLTCLKHTCTSFALKTAATSPIDVRCVHVYSREQESSICVRLVPSAWLSFSLTNELKSRRGIFLTTASKRELSELNGFRGEKRLSTSKSVLCAKQQAVSQ